MNCSQLQEGNPEQSSKLQRRGNGTDRTDCNGEKQQLVRGGSGIESFPFHRDAATQPMQIQGLQTITHQDGGGTMSVSSSNRKLLHSCRFCHHQVSPTPELLTEHESACSMQVQAQQFFQLDQQQQAQQAAAQNELQLLQMQQHLFQGNQHRNQFDLPNELQQTHTNQFHKHFTQGQNLDFNLHSETQRQLQIQQDQMKRQLDTQNQPYLSNSMPMICTIGYGQFMPTASRFKNLFEINDLQGQQYQSKGLNCLSEHQMGSGKADFMGQVQVQPAAAWSLRNKDPIHQNLPRYQSADSSTNQFSLALPEDEEFLTPLHCFVRRYCIEAFVSTPKTVAASCMGKRNHVSANRVGIRCQYCSPARVASSRQGDFAKAASENGVVYPSSVSRIYNSSINLLQRHVRGCPRMPPEILARYEALKSSNARSGASKKYWSLSAEKLGLVDTPDGLRLDKKAHKAYMAAREGNVAVDARPGKDATGGAPSTLLVLPSEKRDTTTFTFHIMSQLRPCTFTEADRLGRRRGLLTGFPGLACRHCLGEHGCSGRFFPSSVKTMADASKTLDVVYRHVMKCKDCPWNIKCGLKTLRTFHDTERSKMPFGNQRAFFLKIWGRLHQDHESSSSAKELVASASSPLSLPPSTPTPIYTNNPTVESLQGLYATVRRQGGSNAEEEHHKKIVTEAA